MAESTTYCDEVRGICADAGVEIAELSTHLQGQLVAVSPAYDIAFDAFASTACQKNPAKRQAWAVEQMKKAAIASKRLNLTTSVSFTGALSFHYVYPWPQRPEGLIEEAFAELGRRWTPILDHYKEHGVSIGYEIHPGEDVFDGVTYETFVDATGGHDRALINYDPNHFSFNKWIIWLLLTCITTGSMRFMLKMPNLTRMGAKAYIQAINLGSTGQAGLAVWVMVKLISRRFFPS